MAKAQKQATLQVANGRKPHRDAAFRATAHAKAHPGQLSYASGGNGTVAHLGMELFKHMAGVDIVHVPYKGTAAVVTALVTGQVQTSVAAGAIVFEFSRSGIADGF